MKTKLSGTAREREVFRYYQPEWHRQNEETAPRPSTDTALTAFAQLGCLRIDAKRCIISLLGNGSEYVLAEASRSLIFQNDARHNPDDELWHGAGVIESRDGVGRTLIDLLGNSKNVVPHVDVTDLSQDKRFSSLSMVTGAPFIRSLFCLPLRTTRGHVIGLYVVIGDEPRNSLKDADIAFLTDMAATTMNHLEAARVKQRHQRAEKMVKALGLYLEGGESLREWWLNAAAEGSNIGQSGINEGRRHGVSLDQQADAQFGVQNPPDQPSLNMMEHLPHRMDSKLGPNRTRSPPDHRSKRPHTYNGSTTSSNPGTLSKMDSTISENDSQNTPATTFDSKVARVFSDRSVDELDTNENSGKILQDDSMSDDVKRSFSRASNLIRESIDVDGVAFFDASVGSPGTQSARDSRRPKAPGPHDNAYIPETTTSTSEAAYSPANSGTDKPNYEYDRFPAAPQQPENPAVIMGYSTRTRSSLKNHLDSHQLHPFPESLVRKMAKRYPHGKIYNFEEDGSFSSSDAESKSGGESDSQQFTEKMRARKAKKKMSREAEAAAILAVIPGARSVAWFPIWDPANERWYGGTLVWSLSPTRVLSQEEELVYLAVWSNSIMAEVSRLLALITSRKKVDFVSSVSHELRSPLHGILASVEFLKDERDLPDTCSDLVNTIDSCGKTLLDTINHVLEFSKINHKKPSKKSKSKYRKYSRESSQEVVDRLSPDPMTNIWILTEEVVDSVYAGRTMNTGFDPNNTPIVVIEDIASNPNWNFEINVGAYRRVLMNLFSNALKYTDSGFVHLSLSLSPGTKPRGGGHRASSSELHLTVSDSGKGISRDFLRDHLYTAFKQENALSAGTGLGLSIVRQILQEVNGNIEIKSEPGAGTQVNVSIPLMSPSSESFAADVNLAAVSTVTKLVKGLSFYLSKSGFNVYPNIKDTPTGILSSEAEGLLLLKKSVASIMTEWYEMAKVDNYDRVNCPFDVLVTMGSDDTERQIKLLEELKSKAQRPVVIALYPASFRGQSYITNSGLKVFYLRLPVSPRKVAHTLHEAFYSSVLDDSSTSSSTSIPRNLYTPPENSRQTSSLPPAQGIVPAVKATTTKPLTRRMKSSFTKPTPLPVEDSIDTPLNPIQGKILLVEDNQINLKILSQYMSKLSQQYILATDGREALDTYISSTESIDLILMDVQMPVMDGMEATREIRRWEVKHGVSPTAVVALTAATGEDVRNEAHASGMDAFLVKPVEMKVLKRVLERLRVGGRRALREFGGEG